MIILMVSIGEHLVRKILAKIQGTDQRTGAENLGTK